MDRIKQICKSENKITIEYDLLKIGQRVIIIEGPLTGLEGYLIGKNDNRKLRIHIESLRCFASVVIDDSQIKIKTI